MSPLKFSDETILEQCKERHPEATTDVEAVDLTAQDFYKTIQSEYAKGKTSEALQEEIALYGRLQYLREELINNHIQELSSYEVKGTGTNG